GTPYRAGGGAEVEDVLAPGVLDGHGRVELLRLRADVVLPQDLAGARLQRGDEAAPRTAAVGRVGADAVLEAAASHDHLVFGQDRRREDAVGRVRAGERLEARVDLPPRLPVGAVERVDGAGDVTGVHRVVGHERGAHEAGGRQAEDRRRSLRRAGAVEPF